MPSLAELAKGLAGVLRRHRDHLGPGQPKEALQPLPPGVPLAALDHEGRLDAGHRRDQSRRIVADQAVESRPFRLVEQGGHDRRGVDHHHHMPRSS
jgi:hypothetical protein